MTAIPFYVLLIVCVLAAWFRRPGPLLYASIFLMPMTQAMPTPVEVLSAPINLVILGFVFAPPRSENQPRLPVRGPILMLVLALLLGLVIRVLSVSPAELFDTDLGGDLLKATWGPLTGFVLYALVFRQLRAVNPTTIRRMVALCQLSFAGEAVVAFVDHLRGSDRATGYLSESNSAGSYFSSAAAFFLAYALFAGGSRRAAYLGGVVLGLAGVVFSSSRGAMLSTVVSCTLVLAVFFTATRERTRTKVLVVVLAVFLAANASLLVPQSVVDRVLLTLGGSMPHGDEETQLDDSSAQRLLFWKTGLELFREWPLGYGTESYPELNEARTGYFKASHNIYVATLVEFGLQGILALLSVLIGVVLYLRRVFVQAADDQRKTLALGLAGWWAAHATAHFFITDFYNVQIVGQFWMLLACLAWMGSQPPVAGDPVRELQVPARPQR